MTDDQGYGDLSCHGNPILKTTNLDRLYAESVRLTDFHVSPFCMPTRAALMTGNHPGYTGAYRTSSGRTMEQPGEAGSKSIVFEIDLPSGPTELVTYLYDNSGKAGGAYFTEVELLTDRVSFTKEEDGGERQ
ncbi:sulfatase-like hydrolase/transferase [Rhodopirellula halodulae]|uniref:sulfatase-like hydrolase/transferase n=1 Tax=Rhodopirellula halodulae TaxID=2894198 RepID=UPI0036F1BC5F